MSKMKKKTPGFGGGMLIATFPSNTDRAAVVVPFSERGCRGMWITGATGTTSSDGNISPQCAEDAADIAVIHSLRYRTAYLITKNRIGLDVTGAWMRASPRIQAPYPHPVAARTHVRETVG
ncbi:hypothetical protein V5799_011023 [Amblyomma americanum]|uniref:Uncharacterized protein n=1 Tax=Amblyomma americanum TaxID=6943 RepID=A0AAQ4EID5_AMBAM